jgi:rod shape-determining protein MreD
MRLVRSLVPLVTVVMLTIFALLPWGMPSEDRFILPLLPIVAIYYWTLDRNAWLPEWAIFLCGVLLDILTQGALGYWALVYLVAYAAAVLCSRTVADTTLQRLGLFAAAIGAVTSFAWLLASAYFIELLDVMPYVRGAAFAVLAAAIITVTSNFLKSSGPPPRPVRLTRGD